MTTRTTPSGRHSTLCRLPSLHKGNAKRQRSAELGLPADDRDHTSPHGGLLDLDLLAGRMELERLEKLPEERLHLDNAARKDDAHQDGGA